MPTGARRPGSGPLYALGAYGLWGVLPVYWKWLAALPATTILAHRVVWSFAFSALLLTVARRWGELAVVLSGRRTLVPLAASSLLISGNWLVFIWAVNHERVVETSLGYYLTPLVNVALGRAFLGERLVPLQLVAVALAAGGVAFQAVGLADVPWVALFLAASFALYGLVRKVAPVSPIPGLAVETLLLLPLAAGYLLWGAEGAGRFDGLDAETRGLLLGSGAITATPLLLFAAAARRLPLSTLGFFQYLGPTITLLVAVLVFGEPFTARHAVTFGFIWAALVVFSLASFRARRADARGGVVDPAATASRDLDPPRAPRDDRSGGSSGGSAGA